MFGRLVAIFDYSRPYSSLPFNNKITTLIPKAVTISSRRV